MPYDAIKHKIRAIHNKIQKQENDIILLEVKEGKATANLDFANFSGSKRIYRFETEWITMNYGSLKLQEGEWEEYNEEIENQDTFDKYYFNHLSFYLTNLPYGVFPFIQYSISCECADEILNQRDIILSSNLYFKVNFVGIIEGEELPEEIKESEELREKMGISEAESLADFSGSAQAKIDVVINGSTFSEYKDINLKITLIIYNPKFYQ